MNLFVGNINPETTVDSLRLLFSEFGEVVSAKILMDNVTGQSRGFGFVEIADKFNSFDAIDNLDSIYFEGNIISVKEAKQNNTGGSRSPKPGGGFRSNNNSTGTGGSFRPRSVPPRPRSTGSPELRPRPRIDEDFNKL